jgi:hypothetical protein
MNENVENSTISSISPINPILIKQIGYVYTLDYMYNQYNNTNNETEINTQINTQINANEISKNDSDINNYIKIRVNRSYKNTVDDIWRDIVSYHDFSIWNHLVDVYSDKKYIYARKEHDINYTTMINFDDALFLEEKRME